jgi:hypothetical protein
MTTESESNCELTTILSKHCIQLDHEDMLVIDVAVKLNGYSNETNATIVCEGNSCAKCDYNYVVGQSYTCTKHFTSYFLSHESNSVYHVHVIGVFIIVSSIAIAFASLAMFVCKYSNRTGYAALDD